MTQQYLTAMAEAFKVAAMYDDHIMTGHLARFLELSLEPVEQLFYFMTHKASMTAGLDTMTVQDIEEYLAERVKQ